MTPIWKSSSRPPGGPPGRLPREDTQRGRRLARKNRHRGRCCCSCPRYCRTRAWYRRHHERPIKERRRAKGRLHRPGLFHVGCCRDARTPSGEAGGVGRPHLGSLRRFFRSVRDRERRGDRHRDRQQESRGHFGLVVGGVWVFHSLLHRAVHASGLE